MDSSMGPAACSPARPTSPWRRRILKPCSTCARAGCAQSLQNRHLHPGVHMFEFGWPWLLLILPLPIVLRLWLPPVRAAPGAALRVPFLDDFLRLEKMASQRRLPRGLLLMAMLAWSLLVAAAARPQWVAGAADVPLSGRDLLLAVDLSRSMEQNDMSWGGETVDRRAGDRVGLILFGERPYLQAPLTFDRQTVKTLLDEAQIGIAGDA